MSNTIFLPKKTYLLKVLFSLSIAFSLVSCKDTDVPISTNSKLPDDRLLGMWYIKSLDDLRSVIEIKKLPDGTAYRVDINYDKKKKVFIRLPETKLLYFLKLPNAQTGELVNFISFGQGKGKYSTVSYKMLNTNLMRSSYLTYNQAENYYQKDGDFYKFGTITNHQNFVRNNLQNTNNYSATYDLERVANLSELARTFSQQIKNTQTLATNVPPPAQKKVLSQSAPVIQAAPVRQPEPAAETASPQFFDSKQSLELSQKYAYYDVYHIQKRFANKISCLSSKLETVTQDLTQSNVTYRANTEFAGYDSEGHLITRPGIAQRVETRGKEDIRTYTIERYTNTCPYKIIVKGINKFTDNYGKLQFGDYSYLVEKNEVLDYTGKIVDNYDPENAKMGVAFYRNELRVDNAGYSTYLKSIANSTKGAFKVFSSSNRTRIFVNPGDKVILNAEGMIRMGFTWFSRPDGIDGSYIKNISSNAKHGALLYKIGDDDDWQLAGSNATITANKPGVLKLVINHNEELDYSNFYTLNYEIIRASR